MTEITKITQEIIPIEQGELGLEVSSILLHRNLGVNTPHRIWISRRIKECGFIEKEDFRTNLYESTGGRRMIEYVLTLDVAKELSMLEYNEIGRDVRRYLIEVEKKYRDFIGFSLPKLDKITHLFGSFDGYNYLQLLHACGCSTVSGSVGTRIRKNKQEFIRDQNNVWYVSETYGKTIIVNAIARKLNNEAKQRRIAYKEVKLIHNS